MGGVRVRNCQPNRNRDGEVVLAIDPTSKKASKLAQALKAWLAQIDSEKSREITAEQLAEWKAKFGA